MLTFSMSIMKHNENIMKGMIIMNNVSECLIPTEEDILRCNRLNLMEKIRAEEEAEKRAEREKKKSPFNNFYQINIKNNAFLSKLAIDQPKALAILLFIFEKMDGYNAVVMPTTVIMEKFNINRHTACKALKYLKDNGYIYCKSAGSMPIYIANNNLVWKSWGSNTAYCEFPANVVLTSTDQEDREEIELKVRKYTSVEVKNEQRKTSTDTTESLN